MTTPYVHQGIFGFTDDRTQLKAVTEFVEAAIADGWDRNSTYAHESVTSAATLYKNGFQMMVICRDHGQCQQVETSIHIWGPDGLAINTPPLYDWNAILEGTRTCLYCGKKDVDTERVNFAGRCCQECLPVQQRLTEYPGWDN